MTKFKIFNQLFLIVFLSVALSVVGIPQQWQVSFYHFMNDDVQHIPYNNVANLNQSELAHEENQFVVYICDRSRFDVLVHSEKANERQILRQKLEPRNMALIALGLQNIRRDHAKNIVPAWICAHIAGLQYNYIQTMGEPEDDFGGIYSIPSANGSIALNCFNNHPYSTELFHDLRTIAPPQTQLQRVVGGGRRTRIPDHILIQRKMRFTKKYLYLSEFNGNILATNRTFITDRIGDDYYFNPSGFRLDPSVKYYFIAIDHSSMDRINRTPAPFIQYLLSKHQETRKRVLVIFCRGLRGGRSALFIPEFIEEITRLSIGNQPDCEPCGHFRRELEAMKRRGFQMRIRITPTDGLSVSLDDILENL